MIEIPSEKKLTRQDRYKQRNPLKTWAHASLRSALRYGVIEKKPCEHCGAENSEGHHPDYSQPAVVKWLCRPCHKAEHRKLKENANADS